MIYAIGDSHANFSFRNIPSVKIFHAGSVTLKRVGTPEDELIPKIIEQLKLTDKDVIIFCFGEIDVRCYVKPTVEHRKTITVDGLLGDWANSYIGRISSLNLNGAKIIIMSVVPPTTKTLANSVHWPVGGDDTERALYTKRINHYLKEGCEKKQWIYLDVYSYYVDDNGMLPNDKSDGTVHLNDTSYVQKLLNEFLQHSMV